jgi:predicted metal-dependent hydrolase
VDGAVLTDAGFPPFLEVEGERLALEVRRKRAKHLYARLRSGTLVVTAPATAPRAWVLEALPRLARTLLRRERGRDLNRDGEALALARRVAARFRRPPRVEAALFSARMETSWGTYTPGTATVRLAAVLRHAPAWVLEVVVAHELCHSFYRGHGPRFRALLRSVCPDAARADGFLDGAQWHARHGARIPPAERGPLGLGATESGAPPPCGEGATGAAPAPAPPGDAPPPRRPRRRPSADDDRQARLPFPE